MESVNIPLVPQWNLKSGCVATPDDGFLYVGVKSINYISKIVENEPPIIKVLQTRQRIKCIDCDPEWSATKYFVALADDNSVQIWDLNEGKAMKGHKGHIKTVCDDGDGPPLESVAVCYLKNRSVLSIDSSCSILYCVSSNTFSRNKRIIPTKHQISIIRSSPCNDKIIAAGTTRGCILIVDLEAENILFTLRGHDTEITSLSWSAFGKIKLSESHRSDICKQNMSTDEIFDIYDYDYLENEFGVPSVEKVVTSDEEIIENADALKDSVENENFNFVEACENLKDTILALKDSDNNELSTPNKSVISKQVTLEDCTIPPHNHSDSSLSCNSIRSSDLADDISENENINKDFDNEKNNTLVNDENDNRENVPKIYLASGSHEPVVYIWDIKLGSCVDKLQMQGGSSLNTFTEVGWLNEKTLITNTRSGEIIIWNSSVNKSDKLTFKEERRSTAHRSVVSFCKLMNNPIIWTISSYREIICEDLELNKVLAKYSCASSNISAIRERPNDMNKIAFAFADRRIGIMDVSNISSTDISIENFSNKIESTVLALCWSPNDRYLAFGTLEGRVGVVDTEKPQCPSVIMKPFSGKPIYSIDWFDKQIYVCSNERVAVYEWNGKIQEPVILNYISQASVISVTRDYLLVGMQTGALVLYKRKLNTNDCKQITSVKVSAKYISEINWSPIDTNKLAVCSMESKIIIYKITTMDTLIVDRILNTSDMSSGNSWVKWSNKNENILLSCGFDGAVRIWNLAKIDSELIFVKYFTSPMLCGIFSPIDENIIICAGKATSIEMFDIRKEESTTISPKMKKNKEKFLGCVQWATKFKINSITNTANERKKNKKQRKQISKEEPIIKSIVENLEALTLENSGNTKDEYGLTNFLKNQTTVLHLMSKELNKDALPCLLSILDDTKNQDSDRKTILTSQLFGSRQTVKELLDTELRNHQNSNTNSLGHIIIPQIKGNLKEEILKCIQSKKLTDLHVSLAPTISYDFWKKSSFAYANQLLDSGFPLQAIPFLLACHEIKESLNCLVNNNYFREAYVIARIYREDGDPILKDILTKWITSLELNGHLEGASLICALSGEMELGYNILSKRRTLSTDHKIILELFKKKNM